MIIFNISGGLGNQFFQYGFGRYLALKNQTDLYLRFASYNSDLNRNPKLDYFNTAYQPAPETQVEKYSMLYRRLHPFFKKIYRKDGLIPMKSYFDDKAEPGFKNNLLRVRKGYFDGYWGNEGYFKEIRPTLMKELELKNEYKSGEFLDMQNEIDSLDAVAVHVRRGDYFSNQKFAQIFNQLSPSYYLDAIQQMSEVVKSPVFYVFSNEDGWAKEHLGPKIKSPYHLMDGRVDGLDYLEFSLMKRCKHFIIANSTFSWWAAWLGQNPDKMVIAPKKWYADQNRQRHYEQNSFLPDNWIKI